MPIFHLQETGRGSSAILLIVDSETGTHSIPRSHAMYRAIQDHYAAGTLTSELFMQLSDSKAAMKKKINDTLVSMSTVLVNDTIPGITPPDEDCDPKTGLHPAFAWLYKKLTNDNVTVMTRFEDNICAVYHGDDLSSNEQKRTIQRLQQLLPGALYRFCVGNGYVPYAHNVPTDAYADTTARTVTNNLAKAIEAFRETKNTTAELFSRSDTTQLFSAHVTTTHNMEHDAVMTLDTNYPLGWMSQYTRIQERPEYISAYSAPAKKEHAALAPQSVFWEEAVL